MAGRDLLFVTKPLAPPWNDSGKNLPYSVACALQHHQVHLLTTAGAALEVPSHVVLERVFSDDAGGFRNPMATNLRTVLRLLRPDPSIALYHFFFTPTRVTAAVARAVQALRFTKHVVQSLNSIPADLDGLRDLVFGERVVVTSRFAESLLITQGIPGGVRIPPCVPAIDPDLVHPEAYRGKRPLFVYAGDLEFSRAPMALAEAIPAMLHRAEVDFVFACRTKTERAVLVRNTITQLLKTRGVPAERVRMLDEVPDMPSLLAASTALVMPVERTYAKMDLPLVVLEALHLGVPCILPAVGPLAELAEQGTGLAVDPSSPEELADAMLRFVREPSLGADLGRAALATWREHYSPARVAPRYEELYDELLGARGPMSHLEAGAT